MTWMFSALVTCIFLLFYDGSTANGQTPTVTTEITSVEQQITTAEAENAKYSGGLVKALIESRIATLKQTRAMLDQRRVAGAANVTVRYTVEGKAFQLPANAASQLVSVEQELAASADRIAAQQQEVARYSGGLVQAMSLSTLATMQNTHAMLDQRRLALKFGLPQYLGFSPASPAAARATGATPLQPATTEQPTTGDAGELPSTRFVAKPSTTPPNPGVIPREFQAAPRIRSKCAADWPDDFRMRDFCEKTQRDALLDLGGRTMDTGDRATIRNKCSVDWPDDFRMRNYCEESQLKALSSLGR